ncbi:flagellar export chaperone FlgN [Egicoccus sp. AB-alg6-2]|uniref:flagellar export chaperone FlgN n=1 Tax=Egicoccus sp. AB-alg6-2 TaxID=3242692 RepID=UPI00359D2837
MRRDRRALEELSRRLWEERQVVNHLLFKLTVTRLLLAADERRFVAQSLEEVELAVEALRQGEYRRDEALRALAALWVYDPEALTLGELARRSPPPFDHTFAEHAVAFRTLAAEVEQVARENRVLAQSDLHIVAGQLDQLSGPQVPVASTYDASGQLDAAAGVGARLREVL